MAFTKINPVVSGIISLWGLGMITYLCRELPLRIWNILEKQFTVTLELQCRDEDFFNFMVWFEKQGFGSKARTLKMSAKEFEEGKTLSAGFGNHYFFYNNRPYKLHRYKETNAGARDIRESLILTTIGRCQKPIRQILDAIDPKKDATKITHIHRWEDAWNFCHEQEARKLDTVILSSEAENVIKNHLTTFKNDKKWFNDHGIPYRTGICLYGPPGTGKTSLVKAIAGMEGRALYILNLGTMNDKSIEAALESAGSNSVILIEDIDAFAETHDRSASTESKKSFLTLSGILNAIDGVSTSNGRILIITTNHLKKLDPALLRPGRINLCLELSYLTDETLQKGMKSFFPNHHFGHLEVKEKLSPAEFQNIVREFKDDPEEVLKRVLKHEVILQAEEVAS